MRLTMLVVVMIWTRVGFAQRQTLRRKLLQSKTVTDKETGLEDEFSCVLEFLQNHLQSREYLSLYLLYPPANQPSDTSELILNQLLQAFPSFLLQGELDADGTQDNNVNAIIILDDFASLQQATANFLDLCNIKCTYTVILAQPVYNDEKEFRNLSSQWTQMLWHHKVINVALIYQIRQKFHMAKSVSFKPNVPCNPSPMKSFGECKSGWKNWQPFDRPARLNNCTVDVAYFKVEPFVFASNDSSKIKGIEADLLHVISRSLNITMIHHEFEWDNTSEVLESLQNMLKCHDLVYGGLIWGPTNDISFTLAYEIVPIIWLIPASSQVTLKGLIAPFEMKVWLAIVAIFIAGAVKSLLLSREISFLEIFSLFLGVAWYKQPRKLSTRLQFFFWAIYGYIVTQFYLASLAGQLVNDSLNQLETLFDLMESGLKFGGTLLVNEVFKDPLADALANDEEERESSYVYEKLVDKFIVFEPDEYVNEMQKLLEGKSKIALALMLNSSGEHPKYSKYVYRLDENLGSFPLAFAAKDGMPYLEQFDRIILWVRAYGITEHLARSYRNPDYDIEEVKLASKNIGIKHLVPGFLLLFIGYAIALLILAAEYAYINFLKTKFRSIKLKRKLEKNM